MTFKMAKGSFHFLYPTLFLTFTVLHSQGNLPLVINTWAFTNATKKAWDVLRSGSNSSVDAVVAGCRICQAQQCDGTVGFGGSPDELGETTLDAMIMDGQTYEVGAVGDLRRVKDAIGVARAVMDYTYQTLLVGESATRFAVEMGFTQESLITNSSTQVWKDWMNNYCQPNYRKNVVPDPSKSCGPYKPRNNKLQKRQHASHYVSHHNHDTIGMVVIDANGNIAAGTSTNGLNHKIPGRVGDSPVVGAGAYASREFGGAAATGDGDVMMRFLPSFRAVMLLGEGQSPSDAALNSIIPIKKYYPAFTGAVIVTDIKGNFGAACAGLSSFHYSVVNPTLGSVSVKQVPCA